MHVQKLLPPFSELLLMHYIESIKLQELRLKDTMSLFVCFFEEGVRAVGLYVVSIHLLIWLIICRRRVPPWEKYDHKNLREAWYIDFEEVWPPIQVRISFASSKSNVTLRPCLVIGLSFIISVSIQSGFHFKRPVHLQAVYAKGPV